MSCSDDTPNPISNDDTESPSAVDDLSVGFTTGYTATLFFTATGDDGIYGRARTYEVRYATTFIDSANYSLANKFTSPNQPHVGTADDTIVVTGLLPNTKYYFAVKVADEVPNWSDISNIDSAQTLLGGLWTVFNTANSDLVDNDIYEIQSAAGIKYISTLSSVSAFDNTNWTTIYDSSLTPLIIDTIPFLTDTIFDTLDFSFANSIDVENSNKIWLGTQSNGVALLEGDSIVFYRSNDSGLLTSTRDIKISQNKLWVGTLANGLHSFNLDGSNIWNQYTVPGNGTFNGQINCLESDINGNVWAGLQLFGTAVFNNGSFTNYGSPEFTNQAVWDIYASTNEILFGTDAGAFVFENNVWTNYVMTDSGLPDNVVTSVVIDNVGTKWFGTRFGLTSFDGSSWTIYTTSNSFLPDNWINILHVDMFGTLWIGTKNGLAKFTP